MRKVMAFLLTILMVSPIFANGFGKLKINITTPVNNNKYFLCLYSVGCLSIKAGNHGKVFHLMPNADVGNIRKIVITDVSTMQMHAQPSNQTCNVKVKENQQLLITGQLVFKNHSPYINHLQCMKIA